MASNDITTMDPPACPLLGLALDRRSRFTFPHQGHRCFATHHPASIDSGRQAAYCLNREYTSCDRYRAWLSTVGSATRPGSVRAADSVSPSAGPVTTVIYVFRTGDSLPKIAAKFGLTVEQLAAANGLAGNVPVAHGVRLMIPLTPRRADQPRAASNRP